MYGPDIFRKLILTIKRSKTRSSTKISRISSKIGQSYKSEISSFTRRTTDTTITETKKKIKSRWRWYGKWKRKWRFSKTEKAKGNFWPDFFDFDWLTSGLKEFSVCAILYAANSNITKAEWYSQVERDEEKTKFKWGKDPSSERANKEITAKLSHFHSLK